MPSAETPLNTWQAAAEYFLAASSAPLILFNHHQDILAVNDQVSALFNQPKAQLIGRSVPDLFPDLNIARNKQAGQPEQGAKYLGFRLTVKCFYSPNNQLAGGFIHFQTVDNAAASQAIPPSDSAARFLSSAAVFASRTEATNSTACPDFLADAAHLAACDANLMPQILQSAPLGLLVYDRQGKVLFCNQALTKFLGIESDGLIGQVLNQNIPIGSCPLPDLQINQVLAGTPVHLKNINLKGHKNSNGQNIRAEAYSVPLRTGQEVWGGLTWLWSPASTGAIAEEPVGFRKAPKTGSRLAVWVTQIEERKRIANKIHNSLGQLLFGIKMGFMQNGDNLAPDLRENLNQLIEEALSETKTIAFELMPAMLEDFGLEKTLEHLIQKYESADLKLSYQSEGLTHRWTANLEIIIFNIIQELVNNVAKHSHATKARIFLTLENNWVYIKVIDNGIGFAKGKLVYALNSTGLRNIKNSLKLFGGQLKISSQVGKGSLISVEIPVTQAGIKSGGKKSGINGRSGSDIH